LGHLDRPLEEHLGGLREELDGTRRPVLVNQLASSLSAAAPLIGAANGVGPDRSFLIPPDCRTSIDHTVVTVEHVGELVVHDVAPVVVPLGAGLDLPPREGNVATRFSGPSHPDRAFSRFQDERAFRHRHPVHEPVGLVAEAEDQAAGVEGDQAAHPIVDHHITATIESHDRFEHPSQLNEPSALGVGERVGEGERHDIRVPFFRRRAPVAELEDSLHEPIHRHEMSTVAPSLVGQPRAGNTALVQLADLVAATIDVGATRARKEKIARLADLLRTATVEEIAVIVGLISGDPRQGRIGVGWATVREVSFGTAPEASRTVADLDALLDAVASTHGEGSQSARVDMLAAFLSETTAEEADFIRRLLIGELRQGANAGIVTDAVAKAIEVPTTVLRRAVMLSGDLGAAAEIGAKDGRSGLEAVGLELERPVQPMLASTAKGVADAITEIGRSSVEWKLDGVRIQVHKRGDTVRVWTRNLNEITGGVPEVVRVVRSLPAESLVLDGEVLGIDESGDPLKFQDTMSNTAGSGDTTMAPFFFDLLHHDGEDLLDVELEERLRRLKAIVGDRKIPGVITESADEGQAMLDEALARHHEGVMVKAADSPYQAGRRGKTWRKVKPVHTLDLVVLAVEHGNGRREGWLSNIHMGARDPETGDFVMVGKTFKGMTDEMLRWQTERFGELAVDDNGWQVTLRPEQVVEIALDGVQRSSKYPGGVALRFARVVRYRDDKSPEEADTIDAVRALG